MLLIQIQVEALSISNLFVYLPKYGESTSRASLGIKCLDFVIAIAIELELQYIQVYNEYDKKLSDSLASIGR